MVSRKKLHYPIQEITEFLKVNTTLTDVSREAQKQLGAVITGLRITKEVIKEEWLKYSAEIEEAKKFRSKLGMLNESVNSKVDLNLIYVLIALSVVIMIICALYFIRFLRRHIPQIPQ